MNTKATIFRANILATTVGATGLKSEVVVPQSRIPIPVEEEVEFLFDQQKYEEYLSSSSRSNSPRHSNKVSAARRIRWASDVESQNGESNPAPLGSGKIPSAPEAQVAPAPEKIADDVPVLSKRARQRQRQAMARKFAKAMESTDGVRYEADLRSKLRQRLQPQKIDGLPKPSTNEWVRVRRNRSTLQERIRKRRALLAQARALVQQARDLKKKEVEKKPPTHRQVWRPKTKGTPTPAVTVSKPKSAKLTAAPKPKAEDASTSITPMMKIASIISRPTAKERLGPVKETWVTPHEGGRTHLKAPPVPPTGLRIEVRESVKTSRKRVSRRVTFGTFDDENRPRRGTLSSDDDDVIPERSCRHSIGCSGNYADELYYQAGNTKKSRKMSSPEKPAHCLCSKLIKAVLSKCSCHGSMTERVSVFNRLGNGASEPKPRHSRKRRSTNRAGELPKVTSYMTGKQPSSHSIPESRRLTRLQSGTLRKPQYDKIMKGLPSEDEVSDTNSAIASDNTVSSEGQPREALMISADQVAKMLEEALTKQRDSFKIEMELTMQQMRQMHDQHIQALTKNQGETSRRVNLVESDAEEPEPENPLEAQNAGGNITNPGDGVANEKMKDLESKLNSLISAQEVNSSIIC